jgi:membrane-bound ClpP family serine protease
MTYHTHHDRFLWGAILIIIGVLFLLDNLGYSIGGIEKWWPLILVIIGIRLLFKPKIRGFNSEKGES